MPGVPPPPLGGDKRGGMWYRYYFPDSINRKPRPLIMFNVFEINQSGKKEFTVCCPHCASRLIIRYGFYQRAHPREEYEIAVQRYLCKSPECPWKTFSVLPYPFLPIIRHFYKTLLLCHCLLNGKQGSQAATARQLGVGRGIVKRLGVFCRRFIPWLNREKIIADWGPDPKDNPAVLWSHFTRDLSQAFYPKRWAEPLPTQLIPISFQ